MIEIFGWVCRAHSSVMCEAARPISRTTAHRHDLVVISVQEPIHLTTDGWDNMRGYWKSWLQLIDVQSIAISQYWKKIYDAICDNLKWMICTMIIFSSWPGIDHDISNHFCINLQENKKKLLWEQTWKFSSAS